MNPIHDNRRLGFKGLFKINPRYIQFMQLDELYCGNMVSSPFLTKFFVSYLKLGGLTEGRYLRLNASLIKLFRPACAARNIDMDNFTYRDLQKVFNHDSKNSEGRIIRISNPNMIPKIDNIDHLETFLTHIIQELKKPDCDIETLKLQWIIQGLPNWVVLDDSEDDSSVEGGRLKIYGGDSDPDCCVCMEVVKTAVFLPCRHLSCCGNCAQKIVVLTNKCPICRSAIESVTEFDSNKHEING